MSEHEKEIQHWKLVAAYLASCHAATLESLPKSASKSNIRRHVSICKKAASMLRGNENPPWHGNIGKDALILADIARCENAATKYDIG